MALRGKTSTRRGYNPVVSPPVTGYKIPTVEKQEEEVVVKKKKKKKKGFLR
tara:strand:- start:201 stop:353 length:153 start_codon:yes stop_codon:yes gene_type:complete